MRSSVNPILRSITAAVERRSFRLWMFRLFWLLVLLLVFVALLEMAPRHRGVTYQEWAMLQAQFMVTQWIGYGQFVRVVVALEYVATAVYLATALLIVVRKAGEPLAIFVSACLLIMSLPFGLTVDIQFPAWLGGVGALLQEIYPVILLIALTGLYAILPEAHSVPRELRWFFGLVSGLLVTVTLLLLMVWPEEFAWTAFYISFVFTIAAMGIAFVFQILHYRHATDPIHRQQVKWIIAGLVGPLVYLILLVYEPPDAYNAIGYYTLLNVLAPFIAMFLPLTVAFAVFRYRLWDIELVASRTLVYGTLTGLLVIFYVLLVGGLSLFFVGQQLIIFVVATGLVALLVQPLHARLQRLANRFFYGQRDDPATIVRRLGEQSERTLAPDALLITLVQTAADALKLPYVAITVNDGRTVAAGLDRTFLPREYLPLGELVCYPLSFQGTSVGELLVSPRAPGEKFGHNDLHLLETIAHQTGPVVHAAQLTGELQRSRQAIVTAREEERRRLRRDLHDGLGPQLASQTLTIDAITRLLKSDPAQAIVLLNDLKQQSRDAIRDIRRLVYELRPPALDDLGLVDALREQAQRASQGDLSVMVDLTAPLPPLSAAVEVAAFRIAQEALNNVVRHAGARHCTITLAAGHYLRLKIDDDGRGLMAGQSTGVGILSMRERAAELGGVCQVHNLPEGGVSVQAELPL